jgi:hypothetical protein
MIDRQGGFVVFECDGCDDVLNTQESEFNVAFQEFRAERWIAKKVGEDWLHLCPDCARDERR